LQWLYKYVSSVCYKCFIYFRRILQVFYLGVAKIDLDVAYTCKGFRCFYLYVASVLSECCICLHWLYTWFHVFSGVFASVSKCFSCFGSILQVFHLGSRGDGGMGYHERVKLALLGPCMRRAQQAEGDGGRSVRPRVHAGMGSRGGIGVRTRRHRGSCFARTRVKWSSRRRRPSGRPSAGHATTKIVDFS
jgi:hypothetical protein